MVSCCFYDYCLYVQYSAISTMVATSLSPLFLSLGSGVATHVEV